MAIVHKPPPDKRKKFYIRLGDGSIHDVFAEHYSRKGKEVVFSNGRGSDTKLVAIFTDVTAMWKLDDD